MIYDFSLEPTKSIDYLKNKGYNLIFDYDEMMHEAHHRAFTVAKVTRLDLLTDIHTSLIDSMKSGKPFEEWKKELIPTLKKYGWYGQITVKDPKTDREKDIYVGSRRLKTIFDTNMRVSYATSRYNEQRESDSEYWRYSAILDGRTRERHRLMHGITLHRDHDFWKTNYPPNGYRCRCKVRAFTKSEIDSRNIIVSDEPPYTTIADKDWNYDVGSGNRISKLSKINIDESLSNLPLIMPKTEYKNMSDEELKQKFYDDLGIKKGDMLIDKINDPMIIDDELFKNGSGFSKITKKDRHIYLDEFAKLLKDPDEIYLELEELKNESDNYIRKTHRLVKKLLKYYQDEKGKKRALIAIFEYQRDKTQGASLHFIDSVGTLEKKRFEKLIWQKELKQD